MVFPRVRKWCNAWGTTIECRGVSLDAGHAARNCGQSTAITPGFFRLLPILLPQILSSSLVACLKRGLRRAGRPWRAGSSSSLFHGRCASQLFRSRFPLRIVSKDAHFQGKRFRLLQRRSNADASQPLGGGTRKRWWSAGLAWWVLVRSLPPPGQHRTPHETTSSEKAPPSSSEAGAEKGLRHCGGASTHASLLSSRACSRENAHAPLIFKEEAGVERPRAVVAPS